MIGFKQLLIFFAYTGIYLVWFILLTTFFAHLMGYQRASAKPSRGRTAYLFLKKHHPKLGLTAVTCVLLHALGMIAYIYSIGGTRLPFFGPLTIILFLLVAIVGVFLYPRLSVFSKKERIFVKLVHIFLVCLALVSFYNHYKEVNPQDFPSKNSSSETKETSENNSESL